MPWRSADSYLFLIAVTVYPALRNPSITPFSPGRCKAPTATNVGAALKISGSFEIQSALRLLISSSINAYESLELV